MQPNPPWRFWPRQRVSLAGYLTVTAHPLPVIVALLFEHCVDDGHHLSGVFYSAATAFLARLCSVYLPDGVIA